MRQLVPQATDFRDAIQTHQFSQLTRRFVLQLLDRFDATERHGGQQRHHLKRRVITAQRRETILQMLEQPVGLESRQRTEHTTERNISAVFKPSRRAWQHAHRGQHAFFGPCTSNAHFGRRIAHAPLGFVGSGTRRIVVRNRRIVARNYLGLGSSRGRALCSFVQPSLVDGFAERVVADTQLVNDLASRATTAEQFLSLHHNLLGDHGGATDFARAIEAGDSFFAIFLYAPFDAVG